MAKIRDILVVILALVLLIATIVNLLTDADAAELWGMSMDRATTTYDVSRGETLCER